MSNRKTTGTRAGLPLDVSAKDLRRILSTSHDNFQKYAKNQHIGQEALYFKTGFYSPKWNSISKRSDQDAIEEYRSENYNGYWKESGWFDHTQIGKNKNDIYISRPRPFADRNKLPYSISNNSTGVFIDLKWSGLQSYYDNDKYCIAGVLKRAVYEQRNQDTGLYSLPYRNYFEFFEHSGFQKYDISNHRFYLESGYRHGQPIGYNKIYFQSGLNPDNFLDYSFLIIPNRRISDYDIRLGDIGKNYIPSNDLLNEPHNVVRYHVFFYTGGLPVTYLTGNNNNIIRGFGFGPIYQHRNSKYKDFINQNYRIDFTGVYSESKTKTFSVFNTGNITERFYIGIDEPNILSIDESKIPGKSEYGVWTYENQSGKRYGQIIDKVYKIGRDANINFKVKINSFACPRDTKRTANINIYRITGGHQPLNNGFPDVIENTGYFSQKYVVPVDIYVKNNSTLIKDDKFLYQNLAGGDFKPISEIGQPIYIDPDDTNSSLNIKNQMGVTFYSVGENLNDLRVTLDAKSKIKRKGIVHPDDVNSNQEQEDDIQA
ncbi:MAG: hypothetical protein EBU90_13700 [Proteobacteria bacterium]|nr:hypothetical protein [Pseudomonadota bacterium]